ncbi:hypothetical protein OCU04_007089 [Sclerotinia nivalis]|uniref:Uncharacterized protein n=1 Tax=Sclerotinia nivalis TaxID=352851 RepID=A0A9X0AM05_9HELO|nr:hypothetical protein OCU04_007089 [Sclerotinia nivalis]
MEVKNSLLEIHCQGSCIFHQREIHGSSNWLCAYTSHQIAIHRSSKHAQTITLLQHTRIPWKTVASPSYLSHSPRSIFILENGRYVGDRAIRCPPNAGNSIFGEIYLANLSDTLAYSSKEHNNF